jgi:hypothetical protein
MNPNPQPFRLLDLPAELRNEIYVYALSGVEICPLASDVIPDKCVHVYLQTPDRRVRWWNPWDGPFALTRTCRQIHGETHLLPFALSTFSTSYPGALRDFVEALEPKWRGVISSVRLELDSRGLEALALWDGWDYEGDEETTLDELVEVVPRALEGLKWLDVRDCLGRAQVVLNMPRAELGERVVFELE